MSASEYPKGQPWFVLDERNAKKIRELESALAEVRNKIVILEHDAKVDEDEMADLKEERDEARKATMWLWNHFDCRAFRSDGYHGDPVPDWIIELMQRLWAARAAGEEGR